MSPDGWGAEIQSDDGIGGVLFGRIHIVVPAVHKLHGDVSKVFARTIGAEPGNDDIHYLAETQRRTMRSYFLRQ